MDGASNGCANGLCAMADCSHTAAVVPILCSISKGFANSWL
ncbi:hypothetical protein MIZ03_4596 [Rhodoferax lithotrophicus]|uniref:Uncharacterized protein n=1 Tax=Rhodoferax lithotrophicus TaxID=2798804 RepID=A0ABN6DCE4_9BURK|nr:hypothetical protein MIZ03_4596 [Rhodoferax sp. MIZ03]